MKTGRCGIGVLLAAHFRADPRKTALLIMLVVVMLVVYVRMFVKGVSVGAAVAGAEPSVVLPPAGPGRPAVTHPDRLPLPEMPARELQGDPFAVDLERYPPAPQGKKDDAGAVVSGHTDDSVREQAESLALQSTLCGPAPIACISGQFLRPGQQINGFVLQRVEPTRVILQREGVQVTLLLKGP